jgi:hypothetical protein
MRATDKPLARNTACGFPHPRQLDLFGDYLSRLETAGEQNTTRRPDRTDAPALPRDHFNEQD